MKKLRMTRLLATSQLNQLVHVREEEIMKLVESLINISREGKSCNLKQEFITMTNNVICRMAMSTRCVEDDANEAKKVKELVNQIVVLGGKLSAGNILGPSAKLDLFGHGRQLRNALEKFDRLVEKIIKEHEDQREMKDMEGSGWRDLMDILLAISGDSNAEMNLTRKDIKAFFLDIIMAGTDTSALTIQWITAELINHQKIFNRLREEIDLANQMEVKGQMFNYLPFGSGRRGCPASSLALVVVQAAIGALVQCFDWEVIGEGKINLQEDSGFSMGIASPLVCCPITRFNPLNKR
ncbi:hypothetical protein H0E87_012265 [Populus deltoides]|uniref:Cytochrome P450 n=1 Tax=Populus deltoides TaxID=3696 RepID=A0A8T2YIG1_POPDE|nr:hypothetical protein H0E87_012265 [Populus deltoides]